MRKTLATNHKLAAWLTICALMLICSLGLAGWAVATAVNDQRSVDHKICVAINDFNVVQTATLQRSLSNLPKLAYFREHTDELASQSDQIRQQLEVFRQRPCQ